MAERHIEEAVDVIAGAATKEVVVSGARRYRNRLMDAFSVAAAQLGQSARVPDPEVERDLSASAAVAAASGLMTSPVDQRGHWWSELSGPVVAGGEDDAVAVLPTEMGALVVTPVTRTRSRFGRRASLPPDAVVLTGDLPVSTRWWDLVRWSIRGRRVSLWALLSVALLGGLTGLLLPIATGLLFATAVPAGNVPMTIGILVAFAIGSVGGALLLIARNIIVIKLRDVSDAHLSPGIMAHLLRLPATFFRQMSSGEILNRALPVESARELVDDGIPSVILTSAFSMVNLVFLFYVDVMLGLVMLLVIAVFVALTVMFQVRARRSLQVTLEARSASDAMVVSLAAAIVPIRVSGAEDRALAQWARLQGRALTAFGRRMREIDRAQPLFTLAPILVMALLVISVVLLVGPKFGSGAFMAAYAAIIQLTVAMNLLAQNLVRLWELGPVLSRMTPITTSPVERPVVRRPPGALQGHIQLTDVVFGYDAERPPLLDGLNIDIASGEFVAIVGPSGGGKSTVLRLILGFENPWSGVVSYGGKDLADLDVAAVRRQIGTVLQTSRPFGGTFRECICGPLQVEEATLWRVIAETGLEQDIERIGLDTPIGIAGSGISGGQRQRLMIARALVSQPRVILLDEATSALDNLTQEIVMASILSRDVTRIAIAHRLTTVERADRILVVSGGRIVEEGPPAELLHSGGHFTRLAARQEF
jgi:ABC-type bacteriocin/lantibiotic exporter with double-glycine peptidase domain